MTMQPPVVGAKLTLGLVIRSAVVGGWALRLIANANEANPWLGLIPALVAAITVAIAIAIEPRAWLRRLALGLVVVLHVFYIRENANDSAFPSAHLALVTCVEATFIVLFLETCLWRWSLVPGIAVALWLTFHLLPLGYASLFAMADGYRVSWLVHAFLLLCANGAWRSIRAELEEDRARWARERLAKL